MMFYVWYVLVDNYIYVVYLVVFVLLVCDFDIDCVVLFYLDIVLGFCLVLDFCIFSNCVVLVGYVLL